MLEWMNKPKSECEQITQLQKLWERQHIAYTNLRTCLRLTPPESLRNDAVVLAYSGEDGLRGRPLKKQKHIGSNWATKKNLITFH